jgi:2-keto-4-pentenoate hydratase/2-oxohepta-3-ene-1,7-dioic acid hydratase in catechol pathway
MKIARFEESYGHQGYASVQPDGSFFEIEGDLYNEFMVTDRVVTPARLLAPIDPPNILAVGLNYKRHAAETGARVPDHPVLFIKTTNSLLGPGAAIEIPVTLASKDVDYEAELAVVIGRTCRNVKRADALDYVLGYTCANDVSARDWQKMGGGGQWCQGKSFDTFCPLGPWLVTPDEIPDPGKLRIRSILNGTTMQDSNTGDMGFDVPALIEFLSSSKTLLPGTVILTGTPEGVGFARKPPVFMKPGDTILIEIEGIGALENPVVLEKV